MRCEWRTVIAIEYCDNVADGTHDSPKQTKMGKFMITSKHLGEYELDFSSAYKISFEDYEKVIARSKVEQWDILFSMIGTIGRVYQEANEKTDYAIKNVGLFRCGGDKQKSDWLRYYLMSPKAQEYIHSRLRGSTQGYIPLGALREMPIDLPPLPEQHSITATLSALDDKIALNIKINRNLEQVAQAIFKSWFVDFEPWGGVMPDGWREGMLSDVCSYNTERVAVSTLTLDTYISTENMSSEKGGFVRAASLPTIPQTTAFAVGDTLISNIRPYFKKIIFCWFAGGCSTDVLCFRPHEASLSHYVYNLLYSDSFFDFMVAGSKGTKMPRGDKQQIMSYPIVLPENNVLADFVKIVEPILSQITINRDENIRLAAIRDALLPKLMSGEIEIK